MRLVRLAPLLTLALAGCGSFGAITIPLGGGNGAATAPPTDFNTVQTGDGTIETNQLPPLDGNASGAETTEPAASPAAIPLEPLAAPNEVGQPDQGAVLAANSNITVEFYDLLGSWTITLRGITCNQFNLTGTTWENGFRASTRNCSSPVLSSISSWQLDGQEVVLFAASEPIARLHAVDLVRDSALIVTARFEGQMISGGDPIVFFGVR
jgi:hypothetical protein